MRLLVVFLLVGLLAPLMMAEDGGLEERREKANRLLSGGMYQEALAVYQELVKDRANVGRKLSWDLVKIGDCFRGLKRDQEAWEYFEWVVENRAEDPYALYSTAGELRSIAHYGAVIDNDFQRGLRDGSGQRANSVKRDRVRVMQVLDKIRRDHLPEMDEEALKRVGRDFLHLYGRELMENMNYPHSAWQLQTLTDLEVLPEVETEHFGVRQTGGAPVEADGVPVYFEVPDTWDAAKNDGERWRWLLAQRAMLGASERGESQLELASFLKQMFGVYTMANSGYRFGHGRDDAQEARDGSFAVHTLKDGETIAKLANGVRRFDLAEGHRYVEIYRDVAEGDWAQDNYRARAWKELAEIYENRRQLGEAEKCWKAAQAAGDTSSHVKERLKQITGDWGQFDGTSTVAAGKEPEVGYRYRNAEVVKLTARAVKVDRLLVDIQEYIKGNPKQVDHGFVTPEQIGYQMAQKERTKYLGEEVAAWEVELEPEDGEFLHWDRRVDVKVPVTKAGAYYVTATLADGNKSEVMVWLEDLAIVHKRSDGGSLYYVADAVTGEPVDGAKIDLFGYELDYLKIPRFGRRHNVKTDAETVKTGKNGTAFVKDREFSSSMQVMAKATVEGRQGAFLGFQRIWCGDLNWSKYKTQKAYLLSDRPVYRPGQPVRVKVWASESAYDHEGKSPFSGDRFTLYIYDPKGEEVLKEEVKADRYGGFDFEYELPDGAALGQYQVNVGGPTHGYLSFRVEEYKKPEYEVTVDAPSEPVKLGDSFEATVRADYYFGAPVTNATVKYSVLRHTHDTRWFPSFRWDWLYGSGYWWYGYDYPWYRGWKHWGCWAPRFSWWGQWNAAPPETVVESEVEIGEDGEVKIEIDTALAKALHPDSDHRYEIKVEVVDESRRTILGSGSVIAARKPFSVHAWTDRGHYRVGDTMEASFTARTADGKPVEGNGTATLYRISYKGEDREPKEEEVAEMEIEMSASDSTQVRFELATAGQYRVAAEVTGAGDVTAEGAAIVVVRGTDPEEVNPDDFRFAALELVVDKSEYAPGEEVDLLINTEVPGLPVLLFVRAENGRVLSKPQLVRGEGRSRGVKIEVEKADMPNFFIEAVAVSNGETVSTTRQVVVPPESRALELTLTPDAETYGPSGEAQVKLTLTDAEGKPYVGSAAVTVYDKSLEYISGGDNTGAMREFFWKWTRNHYPHTTHNLARYFPGLFPKDEAQMQNIGVFGNETGDVSMYGRDRIFETKRKGGMMPKMAAAPMSLSAPMEMAMGADESFGDMVMKQEGSALGQLANANQGQAKMDGDEAFGAPDMVEPEVRSNFADAIYWNAAITTDDSGSAAITIPLPDNLTTWKIKAWAMSEGTRVAEGEVEVITRKDLLVRLQTPRFFVERDEVVLSANVHNYLETNKEVRVQLEIDGGGIGLLDGVDGTEVIQVAAGGDERVDWRISALEEGEVTVRVKALTDEESDAMELTLPVRVHGMLKTESYSGALASGDEANTDTFTLHVPAERRPGESLFELRYSPSVAAAMVDALPYLAEFPYGCTEQTLNRFVPAVVTQSVLGEMGIDLKDIRDKVSNLNPQEIGDDISRAEQWKRWDRNPVFKEGKIDKMVAAGIKRLRGMQNSDGGWGWFSGYEERSYPHTTAVVVEGLLLARSSGAEFDQAVTTAGVSWLERYRAEELRKLQNYEAGKKENVKASANDTDALVYHVLVMDGKGDAAMRRFLYRDRLNLSHYGQAMLGMALDAEEQDEERDMVIANLKQFLKIDAENQTAYLERGQSGWWYWYGDEHEAMAALLRLLSRTEPKSEAASGLAKYLVNNRKNATYWKSTRDTAYCIAALAEYLRASDELNPNVEVAVKVGDQEFETVTINADNLFDFDNQILIAGEDVTTGDHEVTMTRSGKGPLYWNAYLTNFTKEDFITKAGLEVKVERRYYKINKETEAEATAAASGKVVEQNVTRDRRVEITTGDEVMSGDLIEIELIIESKNDYEYLIIADPKAAGFEPHEVQSGYVRNSRLGAYMELRDEEVALFVRRMPRGTHSMTYRMRAETPGKFSALPAKVEAMYAPELVGNSDELKIEVKDQ